MTIIEGLLLFTIIMLILAAITIYNLLDINKHIKETVQEKVSPELVATPYTFDECKEILDTLIADVLVDLELRYKLNEVKIVKNVQKDVTMCSKEVFNLLSPNIYNQLQYHVTERYIMQYVSRNIKSFILAYMKEKNTGA